MKQFSLLFNKPCPKRWVRSSGLMDHEEKFPEHYVVTMKKWFWSRFLLWFNFVRKKNQMNGLIIMQWQLRLENRSIFNRLFLGPIKCTCAIIYHRKNFWEYCTWTPIVLFFLKGCKSVSFFKASLLHIENVCLTFRSYIWKEEPIHRATTVFP